MGMISGGNAIKNTDPATLLAESIFRGGVRWEGVPKFVIPV